MRSLEPEDLEKMKEKFQALDKEKDDLITSENLREAFFKVNLPVEEIENIIVESNLAGKKFINYREFVSMTLDTQ